MAVAMTNPRVELNAVDYSSYATEATLEFEADDLETTSFGDTWRDRIGGLKSGTVSITFNQDYANGTVDSAIWALLGTVVTCKIRSSSSAISTSNPEYQFSVLVNQWNPVNGSVGDLVTVSVSFPITGTVTRATA